MSIRIKPPTNVLCNFASDIVLNECAQGGVWTLDLNVGGERASATVTAQKPSSRSLYVHVETSSATTAPFLAYAIARRARILRLRTIVLDSNSGPLSELLGAEAIGGTDTRGQRYDLALKSVGDQNPECVGKIFGSNSNASLQEIKETALRGIDRAFEGAFYRALETRTLSRPQYIYTLSNMHAFVRWTTRLLGRVVAVSHRESERNEWLEHLREEVNHEKILEKDLAYLGADVEYVKHGFVPNASTRAFMAGQEAIAAFAGDPVVFAAAPIAAEGVAAQWGSAVTDPLQACIASWGFEHPQRGAKFIISHAGFDGGDDGHWAKTLAFVASHIETQKQLEDFLVNLHVCQDGTADAYDSFVADVVDLH